jgi:hypothetical protein
MPRAVSTSRRNLRRTARTWVRLRSVRAVRTGSPRTRQVLIGLWLARGLQRRLRRTPEVLVVDVLPPGRGAVVATAAPLRGRRSRAARRTMVIGGGR